MRASFPSSSSRVLVAAGTGALLVLILIVITGGFVLQLGPLRLSARRWPTPLAIAIGAWAAAALLGRDTLRASAARLGALVERRAVAIAVALAAVTAGAAVAYGTYSAAGADAAGYVSQAHLIASGTLVRDVPLARAVPWPEATWSFAPLGYRPGPGAGTLVPTYPPGLPMVMAASLFLVGENGPYLVVPLFTFVLVLCTCGLGVRLHSRVAGLAAAALVATSPILLFQAVQPMSDVPVTALWTLSLLLALTPVPHSALAAGACAGLAVLTRPNLLPFLLVPLLARPRLLPFGVGLLPAIGALALVNWRLYGGPLASGYGDAGELFALANVLPNARAYAARVLHGELAALALGAGATAIVAIFRLKAEATGTGGGLKAEATGTGGGLKAEATPSGVRLKPDTTYAFAAAAIAIVLACYLPYGVFAEWSYLRFLLPAFPLLFVAIGALVAEASARLPPSARGVVLLAALTTVCAVNVVQASREQAFNLQRYEARYRHAGEYLAAALPSNAVIVTSQQSASAAHYTGLPILRWDLLAVDLDAALAALRALGRHPVLLVEDWETPALQARHPRSTAARLDWTARAQFGRETQVGLFDPGDRR